MQDTATPMVTYVHNGCTADLAIPCWYLEVRRPVPARPHDRMRHDMLGWPWPDKPDECCQEWDFDRRHCRRTPHLRCCPPHCEHFIDMRRLVPIHLTAEGYTDCFVSVRGDDNQDVDGLEILAVIDERDDWVVRVHIDASLSFDSPVAEERHAHYSVFVMDDKGHRDLVSLGTVVVLPTPYDTRK